MRRGFAFLIGLAMAALVSTPAMAGFTLIEKDYVGGDENLPKVGGGADDEATAVASRFAQSDNTIAEGPPPGDAGPDVTGGEFFQRTGVLPVAGPGGTSVNGDAVFQNIPTCPDPTGAGLNQLGFPAEYSWKIKLERPIVSDIQLQICLDVRKCQEEDDALGSTSTVSIRDFIDHLGWEAPLYVRARHIFGTLNPSSGSRPVPDLVVPGLDQVGPFTGFPDLPLAANPADFEDTYLEESISLIGRDCITKWIPNDGLYAANDFVQLDIKVPSSTRVRVRAAQDSVAVCYVGTPLPGECDSIESCQQL